MIDKVQKIREEVERIQLYTQSEVLKQVLDYIDKVQEEPVKIKKGCKYRCLCDMINKDTGNIAFIGGKIYLAPEDNTLVTEENGWRCDTSENTSNFELVEEPISEDLESASEKYACRFSSSKYGHDKVKDAFIAGDKWKEEQMLKDAIDVKVKVDAGGYPYIPQMELYDYDKDVPLAKEGDKYKVVLIKEE